VFDLSEFSGAEHTAAENHGHAVVTITNANGESVTIDPQSGATSSLTLKGIKENILPHMNEHIFQPDRLSKPIRIEHFGSPAEYYQYFGEIPVINRPIQFSIEFFEAIQGTGATECPHCGGGLAEHINDLKAQLKEKKAK
jgi:hypothetical protein